MLKKQPRKKLYLIYDIQLIGKYLAAEFSSMKS
ncbi:MAG: hypothetical protein UR63_C0043G0008 [Candidatus Roizmanbacteria bacterium GW2011_GWC2_35_12]|uniref:Uncharacterized protein n=1 Tax=Candidatus Roizmanbacteria bacterium GW2011_GWC2_35_12 TaxID=1618485 RepID=A0A0G0B8U9_9BACT|nr:MAG: hypothetical protein UR63_C0043G0008 [Candidatus Roizmanbacteria bacterium GW2011_GWC2_35_12]